MNALLIATFALLLFVALTSAAPDWSLDWIDECGGCCVENHSINFTIEVENTGDVPFFMDSARVELKNGTVIAAWGSVDSHGQDIAVDDGKSVVMTGSLPLINATASPFYKACIYWRYNSTLWGDVAEWSCGTDFVSLIYVEADEYQCDSDDDCSSSQYCSIYGCTSECVNITPSSSCGNFSGHQWVEYACCANSDCGASQACVNHVCAEVLCPCGEITNHACVAYECCLNSDCGANRFCSQEHVCETIECDIDNDCQDKEVCSGKKCEPLECQGCTYVSEHVCKRYVCCADNDCQNDETCEGHNCEKLDCEPRGYASLHTCILYECVDGIDCGDNESCVNHECAQLQCNDDEKVKDHTCARLECGALDYAKTHGCVSYFSGEGMGDNPLPLILLIAGIILIIYVIKALRKKRAVLPGTKPAQAGQPKPTTTGASKSTPDSSKPVLVPTSPVQRSAKGRRVKTKGTILEQPDEAKIVAAAENTVQDAESEQGDAAKEIGEAQKLEDIPKKSKSETAKKSEGETGPSI